MKKHYAIRLIFWLLITTTTFAQVVEIPDPNLREAIRETLKIPVGRQITQQHMKTLRRFDAPQMEIANLTGLEYATNLTWIFIWGNPIEDISPLSNLTNLTYLNIAGCQVSDIAPLSNLTKLETLNLGWNRIEDISVLSKLINLKYLLLYGNDIFDYGPLDGLSLEVLERDEVCNFPDLPIEDRIQNRTFPSVFYAWGRSYRSQVMNLPKMSPIEHLTLHDLNWSMPEGASFRETPQGWVMVREGEEPQKLQDEILSLNLNMLLFVEVRIRDDSLITHGEDWPYWLRDSDGNLVRNTAAPYDSYLTDFTKPAMQDKIVGQAIAASKCGLFDGIFFDWFAEAGHFVLYGHYSYEEEQRAKDTILSRIRASVPDDFLIIINTARYKIPRRAWGINGIFMETLSDTQRGLPVQKGNPYGHEGLKQIESTLTWAEENLREPQINCLEGWGDPGEPPDSPTNKRFMRVFTTMSLTLSDGYVLYTDGRSHQHLWYSFWNTDLGRPVSPKAIQYGDVDGLFIREFTNGWAVYNRSGKTQAITLPRVSTSVSSNKQDITHLLPDLDGEIYLRQGKPFDINRDGAVNVLDLIIVSQHFGTAEGDINGDGTTNILDLTVIARQFSQ